MGSSESRLAYTTPEAFGRVQLISTVLSRYIESARRQPGRPPSDAAGRWSGAGDLCPASLVVLLQLLIGRGNRLELRYNAFQVGPPDHGVKLVIADIGINPVPNTSRARDQSGRHRC